MASAKIKWPSDAVLCLENGSTFYSRFSTVFKNRESKLYSIGDCVPIKVNRRVSVMLAEIVELRVDDFETDDDEEECHEKVKIRLYAYPQDTPNGRNHTHGEHELIMFYKHVVLTCKQFLSMEQTDLKWNCGVPLQPKSEQTPPPSPAPSNKSSTSSSIASLLYCNEPMVPIGLFEYEEQSGGSPCSSPIANRAPPTKHSHQPKIKIVTYPVYCRYRAVLARFGGDSAYQYMSIPSVRMRGGIPVPSVTTVMMFCRRTFRDITLERKLNFCVSKEVTFSTVTTRRISSSLSPSPSSTTSSSDNTSALNGSNKSKARNRRGRPRKEDTRTTRGRGYSESSSSSSPMKRRNRSFECDSAPNAKKSNNEEGEEDGDDVSDSEGESPFGDLIDTRKRTRQYFDYCTSSPKRRNHHGPPVRGTTNHHNSTAMTQIVQPPTVMSGSNASSAMAFPILSPNPSVTFDENPNAATSSILKSTATVIQSTIPSAVASKGSCSGASSVNSDVLVHSLRPRSSILPPPHLRDESYELDSDHSSGSSSGDKSSSTSSEPASSTHTSLPSTDYSTSATTNATTATDIDHARSNGLSFNGVTAVTKLNPVYKSSKSTAPGDVTQDVRELLKAYLSCLQLTAGTGSSTTATGESWSEAINSHLEAHLIDERQFLDLLFCFMRLRKTPIHRVPRLGSRNLNLFELYRMTMMLGGYEQVTINRKWSYVFDSLGCAAGMTCASTVTRKHYEKLLLPFERALAAMKK